MTSFFNIAEKYTECIKQALIYISDECAKTVEISTNLKLIKDIDNHWDMTVKLDETITDLKSSPISADLIKEFVSLYQAIVMTRFSDECISKVNPNHISLSASVNPELIVEALTKLNTMRQELIPCIEEISNVIYADIVNLRPKIDNNLVKLIDLNIFNDIKTSITSPPPPASSTAPSRSTRTARDVVLTAATDKGLSVSDVSSSSVPHTSDYKYHAMGIIDSKYIYVMCKENDTVDTGRESGIFIIKGVLTLCVRVKVYDTTDETHNSLKTAVAKVVKIPLSKVFNDTSDDNTYTMPCNVGRCVGDKTCNYMSTSHCDGLQIRANSLPLDQNSDTFFMSLSMIDSIMLSTFGSSCVTNYAYDMYCNNKQIHLPRMVPCKWDNVSNEKIYKDIYDTHRSRTKGTTKAKVVDSEGFQQQ